MKKSRLIMKDSRTLREWTNQYMTDYIQLVCGKHLININNREPGSWFIVKAFFDEKFYFKDYTDNGLLILTSVE